MLTAGVCLHDIPQSTVLCNKHLFTKMREELAGECFQSNEEVGTNWTNVVPSFYFKVSRYTKYIDITMDYVKITDTVNYYPNKSFQIFSIKLDLKKKILQILFCG